jgi:hypothetical protein
LVKTLLPFPRTRALTLIFCLLLWAAGAGAGELSASVDRTRIAINETLTLSVRYDEQVLGDPDFSALEHQFEILTTQRQSQFSFGSGGNTSYTEWLVRLRPREKGELVIPSFHFKGAVSDALTVQVTDAPDTDNQGRQVFIETDIDKSRVHVQEQILFTLRVHTAVVLDKLAMSDLEVADAQVIKLNESQYQKTLNGTPYSVVEIRYALFPQSSGPLTIPAQRFRAVIPDPGSRSSLFSRGGRQVFLNSEEKTVQVQPRPGTVSPAAWLPSQGVSLSQRWSRPLDQLLVGEPVTRTITLTAQGLTGAQLPPLDIPVDDGIKAYPDQPRIQQSLEPEGVLGQRTESMAIVPTRAGKLTLPPVTVRWWDTRADTMRETRLDALTLQVAPAPDTTPATSPTPDSANQAPSPGSSQPDYPPHWLWLSLIGNLVLAVLVLLLAIAWWRGRRTVAPRSTEDDAGKTGVSEDRAFKRVMDCPPDRPRQLRAAILDWAPLFWPEDRADTLERIAGLAGDGELDRQFRALDNALYGPASAPAPAVTSCKERLATVRGEQRHWPGNDGRKLKPLYPD